MAAQERSGFVEIESLHGSIPNWLYEHGVCDGESHHADSPAATRIKDAVRACESEPAPAQRGAGYPSHSARSCTRRGALAYASMHAERGARLSTTELVGCRRTDCDDNDAARAERSDQAGCQQPASTAINHTPKTAMNEQGISEICFEEACTIHPDQTAKSLFSRLAHGCAYADQLLDGLATGYLVALIESVCIREMLHHLDPATEVIVGRAVNIQHCAPAAPGKRIWLRGWTSRLGERSTTFTVQVFDDHEAICDGSLTLMTTSRIAIEAQLARKS